MKKAEENPVLSFTVGLIIMVVMIGGFILAYANIFSDKEIEKNFDEFVEKLNGLSDGDEDSILLNMKEGSAILGFAKAASKLRQVEVTDPGNKLKKEGIDPVKDLYSAEEYFINSLETEKGLAREDSPFDRPSNSCKEDRPCVCLCSKVGYDYQDKKYICSGKIKCESLGGSKDFLKHINVRKLGYHARKEVPIEFLKWVSGGEWSIIDGGFAIERLGDLGLTAGVDDEYPAEVREIYFERKGNIIGVCLDSPCIFEKPSEVTETKAGLVEEKEKSESGDKEGLLE